MSDRRKSKRSRSRSNSQRSHSKGRKNKGQGYHQSSSGHNKNRKSEEKSTYNSKGGASKKKEHKKDHGNSYKHVKSHSKSKSPSSHSSSQERLKRKTSRDNFQSGSQQWNFKAKFEESKWLMIENLPETIEAKEIEEKLTQVSIDCSTSMYEEVKLVPYLASAYILYPSLNASFKTLYHLKGKIKIKEVFYPIDFYSPGGSASAVPVSTSSEPTDWICDKCEYKNFAKRTKCHKCEKPRDYLCRSLQTQSGPGLSTPGNNFEASSSLMVRGCVVSNLTEMDLSEAFERFGRLKSVKLIRNKSTMQQKDFAFVEYFSLEDSEKALLYANSPEFRVGGSNVQVLYSRNKRLEDIQMQQLATNSYEMNAVLMQQIGGNYENYSMYPQPSYTDYDAVGYSAYDIQQQMIQTQQQQQQQQLLSQQQQFPLPNQLPSWPIPNPSVQQAQQSQFIPDMQSPIQPFKPPIQMPTTEFSIVNPLEIRVPQEDLIKQALENAKNHSLALQMMQKDCQLARQGQQLKQHQEEQKKKEEVEKALKAQQEEQIRALEEQKRILDEQQRIQRMNKDQSKQGNVADSKTDSKSGNGVKETNEQKQKVNNDKPKVTEQSQNRQENDSNNYDSLNSQFGEISFELMDKSAPNKSSKQKMFICAPCKRKFDNEKVINLHYKHSKLHQETIKLYGIV